METAKLGPDDSGAGTDDARWRGIDHVQLSIPTGSEDDARAFYVGVLGMTEVVKPARLAARGGAWFRAGGVELHLGADPGFVPAVKAHPGIVIVDLPGFVDARGLEVRWNDEIPGVVRCHLDDPFGNRLELIDAGGEAPA